MRSSPRTLAASDPKWERDHLRHVVVKSEYLSGRADVTLFVPPQVAGRQDIPLILLLHGVYGSHWNWTLKGGAHRTAMRLIEDGILPPVVIAMPSDGLRGDGTAYLPHPTFDAERWIVDDVPKVVHEVEPSITDGSPIFIAGLSMGGFGAMRLGAKYGVRFRGISAHSSVTAVDQFVGIVAEPLDELASAAGTRTVLETIEANRAELPPLRFDCGLDDPLLVHNRGLHQGLLAAGIPHEYEEYPGDHDWAYWETHIENTFRFFGRQLNHSR